MPERDPDEEIAPPTLQALLTCRGSLPDIAACILETGVGSSCADEVYALAEVALLAFTTTDAAWELGYVGALFGTRPSTYLHLTEPVLGYELDRRIAARLQPGQASGEEQDAGGTHFTTGEATV
jgi:hypothetical protein